MNYFKISLLLVCIYISGCSQDVATVSEAKIVELEEFEIFAAVEDAVLATPNIIRYKDASLFVYDAAQGQVLELDEDGAIIKEYGRQGRGPGELLTVNNLYLTVEHLYIVDHWQFMIHKYERGGEFVESINYNSRTNRPNVPPAPISSTTILASDFNNQPFVTLGGDVMLSAVQFEDTVETIYELWAWNGDKQSGIGEVPEGSIFIFDRDEYQAAMENRQTPGFYLSDAFPVNDPANFEEIFLVHSAIPKIAKYDMSGMKLWENEIPKTTEVDSFTIQIFEAAAETNSRLSLRKYLSGVGTKNGELFLAANKSNYFMHLVNRPLWIHRFNATGELIRRYKLISDDIDLIPIFDIDFSGRRIFVVTEEAEIRAYSF